MKPVLKKRILGAYIILFSFLILTFLVFSSQGFYKYYSLNRKLQQLNMKIDSLKKVNDSLKIEIELINNSDEKLEQVARERFGMIKSGEKIYKIQIDE